MAEQKIKDVPMRTVDGVDLKVGMKLYYSEDKSQYDYGSKCRIRTKIIKSMEVIHVNYTHRTFMVRRCDGIELKYGLNGRAMQEFFGKESNAKKNAKTQMMKNITEFRAEIAGKNKVLNLMIQDYKSI